MLIFPQITIISTILATFQAFWGHSSANQGLLVVHSCCQGSKEPFEHSSVPLDSQGFALFVSFFFLLYSGLRPLYRPISVAYGPTYLLRPMGPSAPLVRLIGGQLCYAQLP